MGCRGVRGIGVAEVSWDWQGCRGFQGACRECRGSGIMGCKSCRRHWGGSGVGVLGPAGGVGGVWSWQGHQGTGWGVEAQRVIRGYLGPAGM